MSSKLKDYIIDVPNFPKEGVIFRDISLLLSKHFKEAISELSKVLTKDEWSKVDALVGIESRGFIFACALAEHLNKNIILVRKGGKLPPPVISKSYNLEYGRAIVEIKKGSGNVIIVDDVLATGGTLTASADVCKEAGYTVHGLLTLIDLKYLNNFEWEGLKTKSLIQYKT